MIKPAAFQASGWAESMDFCTERFKKYLKDTQLKLTLGLAH